MRARCLIGWCMPLLSVASLGAAGGDTRLADAVKKADRAAVRALLKQGVDVNAPHGDGATALHWAAYRNDLETADLLIRAGAAVNTANDLGATPLWVACSNGGGAAIIGRLLEAGADPNTALRSGETPLMTASRTGNVDGVKALLAHGADVNATERTRGQSALMWAVAQQHPDVVKVLTEFGSDVHARSRVWTEVVNVGGDGNVSNSTDPTANPPDPVERDHGGFTPLLFAARQGDIDSARLLLAAGSHVNDAAAAGTTALVVAAHSGHGAFATFLLDEGADPNAAGAGYTALHAAVLRSDLQLVKALLAHGANPNVAITRPTPVRRSSQDFALTNPVVGATPLWLAATFLNLDIVRTLAAGGADPQFARNGVTPLMAALQGYRGLGNRVVPAGGAVVQESRALEIARLAIDLGVDVNLANPAGDTPLHLAAAKGFNTVVQLLADKGARLEARNQKGQTPLAVAASSNQDSDRSGSASSSAAAGEGRMSTADLLRKLGARE